MRYEVENEVASMGDVDYWKDAVSAAQKIWYDKGIEELQRAMRVYTAQREPQHVHILLVHGVDAPMLAKARFEAAEHANFVWDQFPHTARLKNSCSYSKPCDATQVFKALWTGLPLEAVQQQEQQQRCGNQTDVWQLQSILRQAQLAGMRTGFITNQRITGATAAALYAQSNWECDGLMPIAAIEAGCADVAQQLLTSATAQALNVIMGGGRQLLSANVPKLPADPLNELLCRARPGRNLLRDWRNQKLKLQPGSRFELVQQASELAALNTSSLNYLLGVFANGDLSRNRAAPSLNLMLNKTLQLLQRPAVPHLLIAEHYIKQEAAALQQLRQLNQTVAELLLQRDTLTLVLFTHGDYKRSNREVSEETELVSTLEQAFDESELQLQLRMQQMPSESLLFAKGPKSLLFYGVHEETYLAQALAYAMRINRYDHNYNN
ncbi:alkaline phosphatase, tissue-nonspecific isozyme [Drosophila busckii]|nr:alkaline phosphatase, tissue-nonspecific isozyme [Drosophila busckii]